MKIKSPIAINGVSEIFRNFETFFFDLWGVIHNGVRLFPDAITTIQKLKENNKKIVLISNAPRTNYSVKNFLKQLGFDLILIDFLVTSGDLTKEYLIENLEKKFFHLGPDKDKDIFEYKGINLTKNLNEADEIVCTGLENIQDDLTKYENIFKIAIQNEKIFICANPDETVIRGDKLEYCAGYLAKFYKEKGGKVKFYGKPYNEIYEYAKNKVEKKFKKKIINSEILAIGDNLNTDILGAKNYNIRSVFIVSGIHNKLFKNFSLSANKSYDEIKNQDINVDYFQNYLSW